MQSKGATGAASVCRPAQPLRSRPSTRSTACACRLKCLPLMQLIAKRTGICYACNVHLQILASFVPLGQALLRAVQQQAVLCRCLSWCGGPVTSGVAAFVSRRLRISTTPLLKANGVWKFSAVQRLLDCPTVGHPRHSGPAAARLSWQQVAMRLLAAPSLSVSEPRSELFWRCCCR